MKGLAERSGTPAFLSRALASKTPPSLYFSPPFPQALAHTHTDTHESSLVYSVMLRRTVQRRFFGGFSSGFSKSFLGGGGGVTGNSPFGSFSFGNAGSGGQGFGGLGGIIDKALEWCSVSHARDIAREQGIDLRDIRFEKTKEGGVNVMVDAPNATPLQIEQLGKRVQEECPVARFRKSQVKSPNQEMKWMRLPPPYDR